MNTFSLEKQSLRLCQERLDSMVDDNHIVTAVLSAPDGRLIASARQNRAHAGGDIARMSQLLLAVAADEQSSYRNRVVCDLKGRPMVILYVGMLILTVIGKLDANMGMVVGIAEQSARELRSLIRLDSSGQPQAGFAFDADGFTQKVLADIERQRQGGELN